jgi:hypothetical protein
LIYAGLRANRRFCTLQANTSFIVGEGEIDEETEEWWVQAYVCVNEAVQHPPAIGATPPERFRQGDR